MFYAYVLKNNHGKRYTGSTQNLQSRLLMHNDLDAKKARFHRTTYKKGPWKIEFSKRFNSRKEAIEFEKFLKTGRGREWLERGRHGD